MHLSLSAISLSLSIYTALAAPPDVSRRQTSLQPWLLTDLRSSSTAGRPGAYPWNTITASLTDPNELVLGTSPRDDSPATLPANGTALNCQAKWLLYNSQTPFNRLWPCDSSGSADGYWTMEILEPSTGFTTHDFDVKFTRVADMLYHGARFTKRYEATVQFRAGLEDGNLSGSCGGSGNCGWGLKPELKPLSVQQSEVPNDWE